MTPTNKNFGLKKEFTDYMGKKLTKKFIANIYDHVSSYSANPIEFEKNLKESIDSLNNLNSFSNFINAAFTWSHSNEGLYYWMDVSEGRFKLWKKERI